MTNEEFEKLKKRVENDPASRMVVPLADEYKKRGMADEAVDMLLKTIDKLPDYPVARVALGKIYIEKGMLTQAREEFEKVVKLTPDNFNAHKRLAAIYREQGENEMAAGQYKIVQGLNPKDEEVITALQELEGGMTDSGTGEAETVGTGTKGDMETLPETSEKESGLHQTEEYADSAAPGVEDTVTSKPGKNRQAVKLDAGEKADRNSDDRIVISMPTSTMADIFVSQGLYDKAMNVYKELLSSDPANEKIMQRQKELKMLIKISKERGGGQ